jgi:hypothetical protein
MLPPTGPGPGNLGKTATARQITAAGQGENMLLSGPIRSIRIRARRDPLTPRGTTHVVQHYPAVLLEPDYTGGQGDWDIQTLADHLDGTPKAGAPVIPGPASLNEASLTAFAEEALGFPVSLTRFDLDIGDGDGGPETTWYPEPGYYVTRRAR